MKRLPTAARPAANPVPAPVGLSSRRPAPLFLGPCVGTDTIAHATATPARSTPTLKDRTVRFDRDLAVVVFGGVFRSHPNATATQANGYPIPLAAPAGPPRADATPALFPASADWWCQARSAPCGAVGHASKILWHRKILKNQGNPRLASPVGELKSALPPPPRSVALRFLAFNWSIAGAKALKTETL